MAGLGENQRKLFLPEEVNLAASSMDLTSALLQKGKVDANDDSYLMQYILRSP